MVANNTFFLFASGVLGKFDELAGFSMHYVHDLTYCPAMHRINTPSNDHLYSTSSRNKTLVILRLISARLAGSSNSLPFVTPTGFRSILMLYIALHSQDSSKGGSSLLFETTILRFSPLSRVRDVARLAYASFGHLRSVKHIISTFLNYESSLVAHS